MVKFTAFTMVAIVIAIVLLGAVHIGGDMALALHTLIAMGR